jgi:hypothetical protein
MMESAEHGQCGDGADRLPAPELRRIAAITPRAKKQIHMRLATADKGLYVSIWRQRVRSELNRS